MYIGTILIVLAACSPREAGVVVSGVRFNAEQIAQGQQLYLQNCAACHGRDGEGQFSSAPLEPDATGRRGAPPHNETGHSWHHSDTLLFRYVHDGGFSDPARFYTMPAFGDQLSEQQILQIIAYIKTLWTDEQRENQQRLTEEEEAQFR